MVYAIIDFALALTSFANAATLPQTALPLIIANYVVGVFWAINGAVSGYRAMNSDQD